MTLLGESCDQCLPACLPAMKSMSRLTVVNHERDSARMTYVYPVVSRRAGGVSIGINLNTNNACNYRCVYCQVPDLIQGKAPEVNMELLEYELRTFLQQVLHGSFMQERVAKEQRVLKDVAFSGNGEPTSSPQFLASAQLLQRVLADMNILGKLPVRVISNGSLTHKPEVEEALRRLGEKGGELWFKLDSATREGTQSVNSNGGSMTERAERLRRVCSVLPTWVQSCFFSVDESPPSTEEVAAYVELLGDLQQENLQYFRGVLLYGLARPSLQPEGPRLSPLPRQWFEMLASKLTRAGVPAEFHL